MWTEPRLIPKPHVFRDARGVFSRTFEAIPGFDVVEENESLSHHKGTIRGLHWQEPEQAKLVRVLEGFIIDVVVNIETHAQRRFEMGNASGSLFVPKGWAHGFCTLEPDTIVLYKVDAPFAPDGQRGFNPFDPKLGIAWPVSEAQAIMSEKDRTQPRIA